MKKNNKKNADIEAVEEVASSIATETAEVETDTPTVVTAEEAATDPTEGDAPETSAGLEITASTADPTEHHIRVKSDSGIYDVVVHADSRQDAKYRVYLQLEQFGPNAVVPKFDVDKYLARQNAAPKKGGKKKGEGKKRSVVVIDLDAPAPEVTDNTDVTDNTEVVEPVSSENIM